MVKRKLNKKKVLAFSISLIVIISFIIITILISKKKNSIEYKLEIHGYNKEEVIYLKNELKNEELNELLAIKYNEYIIELFKQKYFRFDKLEEYLKYYDGALNISSEEVVTKVNTHTTTDFYEEIKDADTSKSELMLVNKIYKLNENYEPEDLVTISNIYAYSGKQISNSILDNVTELIDSAKEANLKLIVSQGYRSYKSQEEAYQNYKMNYGIREADIYVARAGHSDYQTGFSLNIVPYGKIIENAEESEEYKWLIENAHSYGFIQRYPKDKENITGFKYDPWRLRYVGIEAATYIHSKNITFEEYYGYKF